MNWLPVGIVGAGPIGLELAVALKQAGIEYVHLDARQIGHTISWFAPQTKFFSSNERIAIAGVPLQTPNQDKATREQYLAYLRSVVQQFDLQINTYEPVTAIRCHPEGFILRTAPAQGERTWAVRRLILATGGTAKPRRLNVPGEDLPHVSHYFGDPHTYFGKRLLVVGGRNSAVEAALRCHSAGAHVTISYRGPQFDPSHVKYWLLPELNGLIESGKIIACFNTCPRAISPGAVTLAGPEGNHREVQADFVLALIGYEADMTLLKMAGVSLTGAGQVPVFNEQTMETNVPGLYLAGTVVGGTQEKYRVFIENCHIHVKRILASLTGQSPPAAPVPQARPES